MTQVTGYNGKVLVYSICAISVLMMNFSVLEEEEEIEIVNKKKK